MTLLLAPPLLLACLLSTPQTPGALSAPMQRARPLELENLLLEITQRVQWPLEPERDLILLVRPGDFDPQGKQILLGPWLWHRRWEFPLRMGKAPSLGSPFRGATMDAEGKGHILLGATGTRPGRRFAFRLEQCEASAALWPGEPGPAMPALRLHLDGLPALLPDASRRRLFVGDLLLPAFRRASAAKAPDPGPGQRGRGALARPASKPERRRREFHSRDLTGLPLLGLLKEDAEGKLAQSALQAANFENRELAAEQRTYRALLAKFLRDLRWPLPDPAEGKSARRLHADDSWHRGGLEEHAALDLGSLAPTQGKERQWRTGTPVHAPAVGAHALDIARKDGRAWIYEARRGRYRLRLLLALYHLTEEGGTLGLAPPPAGGFERSDPWAILQGWPKGPHAHFEILGLAPGNPAQEAFWVRQALVPALLQAPGARPGSHEPQVLPRPRPDPQTRALTTLALYLPLLPGLKSCRETTKTEKAVMSWELTATRPIPYPAGWTVNAGEMYCLLGWAGQEFAQLRLRGRLDAKGNFAPGKLSADLELQHPRGHRFLALFQEPLRQRLLSDLLPELLLRGQDAPAK